MHWELRGSCTPILHVRCGWEDDDDPDDLVDAGGAFNAFVLPAGGELLCFAIAREATAEQCEALLRSLRAHATVLELELPLHEWVGVTTAPEADVAPDWVVSSIERGSAALQHAMLISARVVAAGCAGVGASVSAAVPSRSRLPPLHEESAERLQHGLEAARTSMRRVSDASGRVMEQGLEVGRAVVQHGSRQVNDWSGNALGLAPSPAAGGRRSPAAGARSPQRRNSGSRSPSPGRGGPSPSSSFDGCDASPREDEKQVLRVPVPMLDEQPRIRPEDEKQVLRVPVPMLDEQPRIRPEDEKQVLRVPVPMLDEQPGVEASGPQAEEPTTLQAGGGVPGHAKPRCLSPLLKEATNFVPVGEGEPSGSGEAPEGATATEVEQQAESDAREWTRLPSVMPLVGDLRVLRWVRPTLSASGCALAAAAESASLAKGLVYVSLKQASSEVATKLLGPAAGAVTAESLDTLSEARSALSSLPISPLGWLLAAVGGQEPPRLLSTAVGAAGEAVAKAEDEGEEGEPWLLLGKPLMEDYLALWLPPRTPEAGPSEATAAVAATATAPPAAVAAATTTTDDAPVVVHDTGGAEDGEWVDAPLSGGPSRQPRSAEQGGGSWQRMWCVLHDSVMALFENQRALDEATAVEFEVLEWSQVCGMTLWPPCAFELQLRNGRTLQLAADSGPRATEWACSILRLVSRRAVLSLQREQAPDWETVLTDADEYAM